jgi:transposase
MEPGTKRSKSYPEQLRKQVLKAVEKLGSCRKAALKFGLPPRTVVDWNKRASKRTAAAVKGRALALSDSGHSLQQIANECDVPVSTVSAWRRGQKIGEGIREEVAESRERWNRQFVAETEGLIEQCFEQAGVQLPNATFKELVQAIGTLADRRQLLSGQPTQRSEIQIDIPALRARLIEAAQEVGLSFQDCYEAYVELAEEQGDRELQRALPALLEAPPSAANIPTYTDKPRTDWR